MSRSGYVVVCLYLATALAGCHPTYVVVPPDPDAPQRQRVVVHDTVVVRDTVRITERLPGRPTARPIARVDTVVRSDTVYRTRLVTRRDTVTVVRVDTVVRMAPGPGVRRPRPDTVFRVDTVTVVRVDTVRIAAAAGPKPRRLVVPPGHHPPAGQCRVWVDGLPPGRQAKAAPCDALGEVPVGAFILFGGMAWDFDYDWLALEEAEPGSVPPQVIAAGRPGRPGGRTPADGGARPRKGSGRG